MEKTQKVDVVLSDNVREFKEQVVKQLDSLARAKVEDIRKQSFDFRGLNKKRQ